MDSGVKIAVVVLCASVMSRHAVADVLHSEPMSDLKPLPLNNQKALPPVKAGLWAIPEVVDANGDGHPDIFVSSPDTVNGCSWYFENRGDGVFRKGARCPLRKQMPGEAPVKPPLALSGRVRANLAHLFRQRRPLNPFPLRNIVFHVFLSFCPARPRVPEKLLL